MFNLLLSSDKGSIDKELGVATYDGTNLTVNGGYLSVFEYLLFKYPAIFGAVWQYFYPLEYERYTIGLHAPFLFRRNTEPRVTDILVGALQPFVDIYNHYKHPFKAYRSWWHVQQDVVSPISAVFAIILGLLSITVSPFVSLMNLLRHGFNMHSEQYTHTLKVDILRSIAWLIDGLSRICYGLTQVAMTPFTFLIAIPTKTIYTLFMRESTFIERDDIKTLIHEGEIALTKHNRKTVATIIFLLHEKAQLAIKHKEVTPMDLHKEETLFHQVNHLKALKEDGGWHKPFSLARINQLCDYFALFKPRNAHTVHTPVLTRVPTRTELAMPELNLAETVQSPSCNPDAAKPKR